MMIPNEQFCRLNSEFGKDDEEDLDDEMGDGNLVASSEDLKLDEPSKATIQPDKSGHLKNA